MVAVTDGEDVETVLTGKPTYVLYAIPDDYGACLRQRIGAAKDALDVPVVEISIDADTGTGTLEASLVEESPAKTDPNLESCGGRICSNVVQEVRAQIEAVSSDVDTGTEVKSRFRVSRVRLRPVCSRKEICRRATPSAKSVPGSAVNPSSSIFEGRVKPIEASR